MDFNDEDLVALFFEVSKLSKYFPRDAYKHIDLYSGQSRCLSTLRSFGSMSQQEMADLLHIRSTSLRESVQKLEAKGMVCKETSAEDKRKRVISLTEKGRQETERRMQEQNRYHTGMLSCLSEEEKEQFYSILNKIRQYYTETEGHGK